MVTVMASSFVSSTFGESHGGGRWGDSSMVPATLQLDLAAIQDTRNPAATAQIKITKRPRKETTGSQILSGLLDGVTLGTLFAMLVRKQGPTSPVPIHRRHGVGLPPSPWPMQRTRLSYGIQARAAADGSSAAETTPGGPPGRFAKATTDSPTPMQRSIAWVKRPHD